MKLVELGPTLLTRDQGAKARETLSTLLKEYKTIEIQFDGVASYTPSFIDEFLGKTLLELGKRKFKLVIRLNATSQDVRHLVNLVLSNRAGNNTG